LKAKDVNRHGAWYTSLAT